MIGLETQLAVPLQLTGGLDRIQYYSGHALQLLCFHHRRPVAPSSDLLAAPLSSELFNVQNIDGSPSLAANVVPSCVVLRGVVR